MKGVLVTSTGTSNASIKEVIAGLDEVSTEEVDVLSERDVWAHSFAEVDFAICFDFESQVFDFLVSQDHLRIFGPPMVHITEQQWGEFEQIVYGPFPAFEADKGRMMQIYLEPTLSNKEELAKLIGWMGANITYDAASADMVVAHHHSAATRGALSCITRPAFIQDCWAAFKHSTDIPANIPNVANYQLKPLEGCTICIGGVDLHQKNHAYSFLWKDIEDLGGNVASSLTSETTHCHNTASNETKTEAHRLGIPIITSRWLIECYKQRRWVNEDADCKFTEDFSPPTPVSQAHSMIAVTPVAQDASLDDRETPAADQTESHVMQSTSGLSDIYTPLSPIKCPSLDDTDDLSSSMIGSPSRSPEERVAASYRHRDGASEFHSPYAARRHPPTSGLRNATTAQQVHQPTAPGHLTHGMPSTDSIATTATVASSTTTTTTTTACTTATTSETSSPSSCHSSSKASPSRDGVVSLADRLSETDMLEQQSSVGRDIVARDGMPSEEEPKRATCDASAFQPTLGINATPHTHASNRPYFAQHLTHLDETSTIDSSCESMTFTAPSPIRLKDHTASKRGKKNEKLFRTTLELYEKEANLHSNMKKLKAFGEMFLQKYPEASSLRTLFDRIGDVAKLSADLSAALFKVTTNETQSNGGGFTVSQAFSEERLERMKNVYIAFVRQYHHWETTLKRVLKRLDVQDEFDKDFKRFFDGKMTFADVFAFPMQRSGRIRLQIQEILKSTDASNPDYEPLKAVLEKLAKLQEMINELRGQDDDRTKANNVLKMIENLDPKLYHRDNAIMGDILVAHAKRDEVARLIILLPGKLVYTIKHNKKFVFKKALDILQCNIHEVLLPPSVEGKGLRIVHNVSASDAADGDFENTPIVDDFVAANADEFLVFLYHVRKVRMDAGVALSDKQQQDEAYWERLKETTQYPRNLLNSTLSTTIDQDQSRFRQGRWRLSFKRPRKAVRNTLNAVSSTVRRGSNALRNVSFKGKFQRGRKKSQPGPEAARRQEKDEDDGDEEG